MTKDERLLLEIYRFILQKGGKNATADPEEIRKAIGYKEHLMNNILKGLMQANLVKRYGPDEIGLTERGKEVVKSLL